jgi:hypothetical protein
MNSSLNDKQFSDFLAFEDLKEEYKREKKLLFQTIDERYEHERNQNIEKRLKGIKEDKSHRMVLNACIFPFSQDGLLSRYGYYFIRASPLSELKISNLDFLIFRPKTPAYAIFGEAKGTVNDAERVVSEFKQRMQLVIDRRDYVIQNYLTKIEAEFEFVIGVNGPSANEIMKSVVRKGGQIKVWSTWIEPTSMKPELSLLTPLRDDLPNYKTMIHGDQSFSKNLHNIETSFDYKSIFPESHTFAKLVLLTLVNTDNEGIFTFDDLFGLMKEELDYVEELTVKEETTRLLKVAEDIKFVEEIEGQAGNYKIIAKGRKADTREAEIKKKWIDFAIQKDKEQEKFGEILILQEKFRTKRQQRRTITDYS